VFLSAMVGEHPVGRQVIGSCRVVSAMDAGATAFRFQFRRYTPVRIVVAVAGKCEHERVSVCVSTSGRGGSRRARCPAQGHRAGPAADLQLVHAKKNSRLSIGVRTPGRNWDPVGRVGAKPRWGAPEFAAVSKDAEHAAWRIRVLDRGPLLRQWGTVGLRACQPETVRPSGDGPPSTREMWLRDGITEGGMPNRQGIAARRLVLGVEVPGSRMNRIGPQ